jgi:hypothetical protein
MDNKYPQIKSHRFALRFYKTRLRRLIKLFKNINAGLYVFGILLNPSQADAI